mmetsp:Transcript_97695/g.203881  ORF Transcript_97695/g.203881 Transcript_97695/m.203881 type:complete len:207 (-) Transcript_97695:198-818(-)
MSMVTPTRVNGGTTRRTEREYIITLMDPITKVSGKMINNMGRDPRPGRMVRSTLANMPTAKRAAVGASLGQMVPSTTEISWRTTSTLTACIDGEMVDNTVEIGIATACTEMASSHGQTAANMKASTTTIKRTAKGSSPGQMDAPTTASGKMGSSTARASTSPRAGTKGAENGSTASDFVGSTSRNKHNKKHEKDKARRGGLGLRKT